jgi:predicted transcriptional regulator
MSEPNLSDLQLKVFDLIRLAGWDGKTTDELEAALGLSHQSVSARVHELMKAGLIERRGARRRTRQGRMAFIFVLAGLPDAATRRAEQPEKK